MGDSFGAIFLGYPTKDFASPVIIEIGIDIGQGDTVRVQETLEQQVVLDRVDLRDAKAIGYSRSRRRSTAWSDRNSQFLTCGPDKILHDQEVARETHGLHDVQLEVQSFFYLVG